MSYYHTSVPRLASGLFFRAEPTERLVQRPIGSEGVAHHKIKYDEFVVPEYRQTREGNELYLPLLEVSVEIEVVGTIAWTKLTQTFTNRATFPIKEATYCFPLYERSTVTSFTCSIGSEQALKGVVKPKAQARAEFNAAAVRQRVAALLEEHTPEVFETSISNILAQSTVKIKICYITELKADLSGDGIFVTVPTSVAPRYGTPPSSSPSSTTSKSLAVPPENGLQIQVRVSSPVAINMIESRTHPVTIEMGSHGHTTTKNIRDLVKKQESSGYDPKKARATLSDRSACLGKDFVLLIQSRGGTLLASRATKETHPKLPNHSALMVSINLRDMFTPNVNAPKLASEIIFFADRSGSMQDKIETLRIAMRFFLKSLPNNCYFNICSFGSNHVSMWPESRSYNEENLDKAMAYITTNFYADMGGTELLSALRNVVPSRNPAFSTQIIIFTDGEVWDSANTFEFIKDTRSAEEKGKTRFFALGIGDAVSHHFIEGVGRYGGGLAEVVPADSAGDWKGRVIRMLEAALTPSTWKVEISLDDIPITTNGEEQVYIQAPHHIPDFHAFSRSSVYFLFRQELKAKTVKIKATATSGETVTSELPIQRLGCRRTCVHLLAAKAVLNDLESGQSWLHAISQSDDGKIKPEVEDLARAEGEKIGTEWSISSKWTNFVVVDNSNSLEKPSRWYQAEKIDLTELTRTRFGAMNNSFAGDLFASQSLNSAPSPSFMEQEFSNNLSMDRRSSDVIKDSLSSADKVLSDENDHSFIDQQSLSAANPKAPDYPLQALGGQLVNMTIDDNSEEMNVPPEYEWVPPSWKLTGSGDLMMLGNPISAIYRSNPVAAKFDMDLDADVFEQSLSQPKCQPITREITLEDFIDSHTAEGSFKLDYELGTKLKNKFHHWRFDLLVSELGESIMYRNVDKVLETARAIVLIEAIYAESRELWWLVIQKANSFVTTVILDNEQRGKLFWILQNQLLGDQEVMIQALRGNRWWVDHREEFDRILRSHLLDEPDELLRLLRKYIVYGQEELIRNLGSQIPNERAGGQVDAGNGVEDPNGWTDGWDDISKVSQAIRLVMSEKGIQSGSEREGQTSECREC